MCTLAITIRQNSGKLIPCFLLFAALFVLPASPLAAKCSEEDVSIKLFYSLGFRGELMEDDDMKSMMYQQAAMPHIAKLEELESNIQTDTGDRQNNIDQMCKELDSIIAVADDILTGGSGTGKRLLTPWKQYTPEDLIELQMEYEQICENDDANQCYNEAAGQLEDERDNLTRMLEDGEIKYPAFVDRVCENLKKAIKSVK